MVGKGYSLPRVVERDDYAAIRDRIIGLSHLVTVQSNGTMVTELTAMPSDLLTDRSV